jgi:hypothetical protein
MNQYDQPFVRSSWSAQDQLLAGMTSSRQSDRNLSQLAADRYALREALAEQRRQRRSSRQPRRLWTWRHARRTEATTA